MYGALKLYEIPMEIVLTTNRYQLPFPDTIENYSMLDDYLFFFPTFNDFTMPDAQLYRVGLVPYGFIFTNGLFIREVKLGDFQTGAGKVKPIPAYPKEHSVHDMWIEVALEDEMGNVRVKMKEVMTGFNALSFQPYFDYVSAENEKTLREATVKEVFENAEILSVTLTNEGAGNLMLKPFIIESEYLNPELLQVAGNKVLLKFGELIGPQAEMYQEDQRVLDVENTYNHSYHRELTLTIPDGYTCTNLNDLNMDITPFDDDHTGFVSTYTLEGNTVKVIVDEYYDEMLLPLADYEALRSVINAAANFNKITLVFEQK
jgi:hypothetical protein